MDRPTLSLKAIPPRPEGKTKLFKIPVTVIETEVDDSVPLSSKQVDLILNYLYDEDLQYGDVIRILANTEYRNAGKYMWDGMEFICLDSSIDDYGCVPSNFVVITSNYPPNYWSEAIEHNNIVWLAVDKLKDQLLSNYKLTTNVDDYDSTLKDGFITSFIHGSSTYYITNGFLVPENGECYTEFEDDAVGYFGREMTEKIFLEMIAGDDPVPVEFDESNPNILHLCIVQEEDFSYLYPKCINTVQLSLEELPEDFHQSGQIIYPNHSAACQKAFNGKMAQQALGSFHTNKKDLNSDSSDSY